MHWLTQLPHVIDHLFGATGLTIPEGQQTISEVAHLFVPEYRASGAFK